MRYIFCLLIGFAFLGTALPAAAQEAPPNDSSFLSRFLFSQEEIEKLKQALGGAFKRAPEVPQSAEQDDDAPAAEYPRIVSMSGLIYTGPQDWTFWLNGVRVTPDKMMDELQNLYVTKHYIDFSWLDRQTNQLYPLRLRPHQSFHLDTKVFFTGAHPGQPVEKPVE